VFFNKPVSSPERHSIVIKSHVKFPEIQELMFPTMATTSAAKLDHAAGGQLLLHTGKVMSDCYSDKYDRYLCNVVI
jgi:hypothetical protein